MLEKFILKFYHLSDHNEEETKEDDNPNETDNVPETYLTLKHPSKDTEKPWLENRVPYQLCDHICKPYRFKNGGTKRPTCTSDIDGFCNGGELPGMVRMGSMTYFQDHGWYDKLADGKLKDETLALKAKIKGSWGDATPGVLKFCKWLKSCFENFHKIEYEVLDNIEQLGPAILQQNNGNSSSPYRGRTSLAGNIDQIYGKTAKRQKKTTNIIKEIQLLPMPNKKSVARIKTLEIQNEQISKVLYAVSDVVHMPYRARSTGAYFLKQSLSQDDCKTSLMTIGERHKM
ncbi:hypothetical protein Tco_0262569 [Tanacetum coccineum]